jgi:putative solute:sodium symporter small subunit
LAPAQLRHLLGHQQSAVGAEPHHHGLGEADRLDAAAGAARRAGLLIIWFVVSYGLGIILVEPLNSIMLGGYPLGFWFAQQGSIYVFLVLIFVYAIGMNRSTRNSTSTNKGPHNMTNLDIWTYAVVGATFALYIGIAIWARAGTTGEFYVAGKGVHPSPTAWRPPRTGCPPPPSSRWRA